MTKGDAENEREERGSLRDAQRTRQLDSLFTALSAAKSELDNERTRYGATTAEGFAAANAVSITELASRICEKGLFADTSSCVSYYNFCFLYFRCESP